MTCEEEEEEEEGHGTKLHRLGKDDMEAPRPLTVLRGHQDSVNTLHFIASNKGIASGSVDGVLNVWSLETRRPEATCLPHSKISIISVAPIARDQKLVTAGRDGTVKVLDMSNEACCKEVASICTRCFHFCNAATDRDNIDENTIVTPCGEDDESNILIWDRRDLSKPVHRIVPDEENVGMTSSLVFASTWGTQQGSDTCTAPTDPSSSASPSSSSLSPAASTFTAATIFAGFESGSVAAYDMRTFQRVVSIPFQSHPTMAIDVNPMNKSVAFAGAGESLNLYSIDKDGSHECRKSVVLETPGISSIRYRSDYRIFATGNWDSSVRIYSSKSGKAFCILNYHRESVYTVDFGMSLENTDTATRTLLAAGSKDNSISLWNIYQDTYRPRFDGLADNVD